MATVQESAQATQEFVPIKEVRDGILILKDGSMRALLMASSINFALKSADEQNATILQFQNFLNSLNFSIQMFVQSRRLDIRPYIALLEDRFKEQTTELMRVQTREYINFVRAFTDNTNIMTKTFFIVVPYTPPVLGGGGKSKMSLFGKKKNTVAEKTATFEEHRTQIEQRLAVVEQGIMRCGIRSVQLGTEEMIEVFYKLFNPGEMDKPIINQ
jgi:hypothetical protein